MKGTFWLAYCMPGHGSSLLRSTNGTAEGPYEDVHPVGPLVAEEIDGSLFEDDDGTVWFVWQGGSLARLNDEMTDLASEPLAIRPKNHGHVGFEGAFLVKAQGRYHLFAAEFQDPAAGPVDVDAFGAAMKELADEGDDYITGSNKVGFHYSCMAASADNLAGPWSDRYLVAEHAGHNTVFQDADRRWWSTIFGNDPCAPLRERPGIFPLEIDPTGHWHPVAEEAAQPVLPGSWGTAQQAPG